MIDLMTKLSFSLHQNKGVYAVLLGSGISRAAGIMTGWEVTLDLVRRVAEIQGVEPQADWAAWYRKIYGKEPDYSDLLDTLTSTPEERRSILHEYIEPTEDDREQGLKVPTEAHRAIARLVRGGFIRVILTTNFDRLMEQALSAEGIEPTVIFSDDSLHGAVPLIHSCCTVVKLHGDYLDPRSKNTEQELSEYSAEMNQFLDRILDDHGLIVCGWSAGWDTALRAALMRAPNRRYGMFWAQVGTLTDHASDVVRHRQADIIQIKGADAFLGTLADQVLALEDRKMIDPQNITLLLATAKRYIPRPEYRVQLADLIGEAQRTLQQGIAAEGFSLRAKICGEEVRRRVSRYEDVCEPLVRLLGVLGRHGDGAEEAAVADVLRDLMAVQTIYDNHVDTWTDLRRYPAFLAWYGYGLGLVVAGRFDVLFRWLTQRVQKDYREMQPAVLSFRLREYGGRVDYWKKLDGQQDSKTPLSDHLLKVFSRWMPDYMPSAARQEEMFDLFELLMLFATFPSGRGEGVKFEKEQYTAHTPYGRFAVLTERYERALGSVAKGSIREKILSAGFFSGRETCLDEAVKFLPTPFRKEARPD